MENKASSRKVGTLPLAGAAAGRLDSRLNSKATAKATANAGGISPSFGSFEAGDGEGVGE